MSILSSRKFQRRFLAAIALAVVLPVAAPVWAQQDYGNIGTQSMRAKRDAARKAQQAEAKGEEAVPALYPQATRQEPEAKATRNGVKRLQKLAETYQKGEDDATIAAALDVAGNSESNDYEKAFAYQVAGNAASNKGDDAAAADFFGKALASNGLANNDHYTVMFNLAVVQYGLEQYPQALQNLDRFLAETKSDKIEARNLRGGILMAMERYGEAAELYTQLLAAHPDDKTVRMNAVAAYQQAEQPEKAVALLAQAQAKGQLTSANEYRALYVTYINADRDKDAVAVIADGLAKGILTPGPDLSRDYMVHGQKPYYASDLATSTEMYKQAASMAANGEASLNLAKIYAEDGKKAEARAAAQQALDKGVEDTAGAKRLVEGK
jgi:tetratricopeptide (TPR) repeat protein